MNPNAFAANNTNESESNMGGPFPNRHDRFHSPMQEGYSSKVNPYGSRSG